MAKKNDSSQQEILRLLHEIRDECRVLRNRMVSLESWMAALSKGKDLGKSHKFTKDIEDLSNNLAPTITMKPPSAICIIERDCK